MMEHLTQILMLLGVAVAVVLACQPNYRAVMLLADGKRFLWAIL